MSPSPNVGGLRIEAKGVVDPYALLGLQPDACDAWIRSAFRRASLQVHPDRCPDDPEAANRFRELTLAKELLLNPLRRRLYDSAHGIKIQQQTDRWWVDWDSIFSELDPAERPGPQDAAAEESAADCAVPSVPRPFDGRPQEQAQADILVVGATGIVGTMACKLLEQGFDGRTWAIAGRDGRKLQLLEGKFGRGPEYRGSFQLTNAQDVLNAVKSARVVVDLTGPSYIAGAGVAEACALTGRHYVDNTLEANFSKLVKDKCHAQAKATGSCLVMHAGDASMVPDFGTWYLTRYMRDKYRAPLRQVIMFEWAVGILISGSSYLSGGRGGYWAGHDTRGVDPFLLGGKRATGVREEDKELNKAVEHGEHGVVCLQSAMIDRLVVRATAGLLDSSTPYGRRFHFNNWVPFLDSETADAHQLKSVIVQNKLESLVKEKKIPPAGHGPGERSRRERLDTRLFVATTDESNPKTPPRTAHMVLSTGPGGIGDRYEGTAAMTLEAASKLLETEDQGKGRMLRPGWGTPVYHLAHLGGFMERLVARGMRIHVADGPPPPELLRNIVSSTMPLEF
mmetsp:Transcript_52528/g.163065  ORF Transcript_52528/g.163065 Transcript_52528/m.163065 type:complete len:566 (+) Transcript_52528:151-1848(+)